MKNRIIRSKMAAKHNAEVALRKAASEFTAALRMPVTGTDRAFKKIDDRLMKAAIHYTQTKMESRW